MAMFVVYTGREGKYRWGLQANNYRTVADFGEGYNSRESCLHGIRVLKGNDGSYGTEGAHGEARYRGAAQARSRRPQNG